MNKVTLIVFLVLLMPPLFAQQPSCKNIPGNIIGFLVAGGDPFERDSQQRTILHNYCRTSDEAEDLEEFLIYVKMQHSERFTKFLEAQDQYCATALSIAISKGNHACVRLLLKHGANPNNNEEYGSAPLHNAVWAIMRDRDPVAVPIMNDIIRELCSRGADPDLKEHWYQKTPAELLRMFNAEGVKNYPFTLEILDYYSRVRAAL